MKLFIDSANIDEIELAVSSTAITGVTTNPSLMAKEERGSSTYISKLMEIAELLSDLPSPVRHLSVEVIDEDPTGMLMQAETLSEKILGSIDDEVNLHVKIPVTLETLPVITSLERAQIPVNATACMTYGQAKLALDAGAGVVSFFYNRMKDGGDHFPDSEVEDTRKYINGRMSRGIVWVDPYFSPRRPEIICGSIRSVHDVFSCWDAGADIVTAPMKVIRQMVSHHKTDEAIEAFKRDIQEWD